jgi:hypothetical protein
MDRAEPGRVIIDLHFVRRVGEGHRGAVLAQQWRETHRIEGAAAQHAMATELPEVSDFVERWRRPRSVTLNKKYSSPF